MKNKTRIFPPNKADTEHDKAIAKLRTAIQFWNSFSRTYFRDSHTRETLEITINSLKYVVSKLEKQEIDMKLFSREVK